jgi:hypothetical protein
MCAFPKASVSVKILDVYFTTITPSDRGDSKIQNAAAHRPQ